MASLSHTVALVILLSAVVLAQTPFSVIPTVSDAVKQNAIKGGAGSFVRLWEYALKVDGQGPGPANRINFEAKTILAPGGLAMINLVPQDAAHPLYGNTQELKTLRSTFLKDHLVLDPIKTDHPDITKKEGVRALTFSGKDVHIKKNAKGKILVENIPVSQVMSLNDGTQIYILDDILFDNRQQVNDVFSARFASELNGPTGPPLDILGTGFVPSPQFGGPPGSPQFSGFTPVFPSSPPRARTPAPPPPSLVGVQPPAPPTVFSGGRAPAPPPVFSEARAPAPPTLAGVQPPAPPPPRFSFRAPAPPPRQFSGPPSPPNPPAPPAADDSVIFPEASQGKRVKRQLSFLGLDDLSTLDPVLQRDSSDLALPKGFSFNPSSSTGRTGYLGQPGATGLQLQSSNLGNNRPLSELSSIEQFATLFQLANSPDGSSIVRVLQEAGLVTMLGLLETSGLLQHLVSGDKGHYILLVPSESAFSSLSRQELYDLTRGTDLSYHVIPLQGQLAPEVTNDSTFVTLLGPQLRFNVYGGVTYANGVPLTRSDLTFSYGTIQVVDSVLQPPVGDIRGVLVNHGHSVNRINTLLTVIGAFDQGVYTLLAPPDSAISSKGYSWPELLMQRALGKDLLDRHIFKGTWYSEGLLQQRTMKTLAGTSVTFRRELDGTITANGVPMRSCNLSATNGVVHLVADVIPDSDLGYDPTAIPNPLIAQTESSIFENFGNGGDIVPEVPVISGLYELPGRNSFQEFRPINSNPVNSERSDLPESQLLDSILFQNHPGNGPNIFNTPQVFNNIQPVNNNNNRNQISPPGAIIPGSFRPTGEPLNPELFSFLEMLDKTDENYPNGEATTQPQKTTYGNDYSNILGANIANNVVKPLASVDQSVPQGTNGNLEYGLGIATGDVGSPFGTNTQQNTPTPASGRIIKERPITSPNVIIVVDPTSQPATYASISNVDPESASFLRTLVFTGNYTTEKSLAGVNSAFPEESFPNEFETTSQLSPPIPLVPEGPFVWRPEGAITEEERRQMNVVSLLRRLNLTKFAELVEISGLTRTLNFEGPWTVFAPSNKAIEAIPEAAFQEMIAHPRFLRRVVSYHLAPGRFLSDNAFSPGIHLPTLHAGYILVISYYTDGPVARWVAGGSVITDLDEEANNGVVHVLDQVLYAPYGHLVTTVSLSPILSIFSEILASDIDVQNYLSGSEPLTLFAPSDDSLRNLTIPVDPLTRRAWILSHVVEGTWYTSGFSNTWPLTSYTNYTLVTNISSDAENITVNGVEITYADVTAANGVLHVMGSPLFSPP